MNYVGLGCLVVYFERENEIYYFWGINLPYFFFFLPLMLGKMVYGLLQSGKVSVGLHTLLNQEIARKECIYS